ncbi:MAG: HEAT repeat domain-containing protein [Terrimicrobiaceae bacterium]
MFLLLLSQWSDGQANIAAPQNENSPNVRSARGNTASDSIQAQLPPKTSDLGSGNSVPDRIKQLARLGTAAAIQDLAHILESLPLGDLREEAVRIASTAGNPEAVPVVLDLLQSTDDAGVIRMSQEILARLAGPESIQSMLSIYDDSTDTEFRDRLERTVAYISTEEAVPVLKLVVSDISTPATDGMIRAGAQALRKIGTPPAVDTLIERLNSETNEEGRSVIAAQIGEVRAPSAEASLQSAALGQSKFASQVQTRVTAIGTLLYYPSAETQELLAGLAADPDQQISAAATDILTEIKKRLNN